MRTIFDKLRFLPLLLGMVYLLLSIALFFIGPFDWPVNNRGDVLFFLLVVMVALCGGYLLGSFMRPPGGALGHWRLYYRLGALLSIALLFPATYAYTGKWPWHVANVLGNQGVAYEEMLAALEANESGIRSYIAIARALAAPFVCCVVPFAILHWRSLRLLDVLLLLGHIGAVLVFSLMRGTDRETGDLLVSVLAAAMILASQVFARLGRFPLNTGKALVALAFVSVIVFSTLSLFIERKEARMGGNDVFCVAEGVVCSQRPLMVEPGAGRLSFTAEMLTAYMAQGYYGLSLALNADFTSTMGAGHSAFIMSTISKVFGDDLYMDSYQHKVDMAGWSDKSQWSTMFTWIASDVGFPAVPLFIFVLGFLWASAWKSAVLWRSESGALVFIFLTLSILYMPANNQLTQTLDSYFAFLFWLLAWGLQRRNASSDR